MSLDDVVQLTITLNSSAPTKAGFGRALLVGYHNHWVDRTRLYKTPDAMLLDGFVATDYLYKMAVALKSQNPSPKDFKIGRLSTQPVQIITLAPTSTVQGTIYKGTIGTELFTYTVPGAATISSICTALVALIDPFTGVGATTDATKVTVTTSVAGAVLQYTELSPEFTVNDATTDVVSQIATELAAIYTADSDWYAILLANNSELILNAVAVWVETKRRLLVAGSADSGVKGSSTTDIASDLKGFNDFRTGLWYHQDVASTLPAAITGQRLTSVPGSDTWAHKEVVGVPVSTLTAAEETNLTGKHANYYITLAGNGNTLWGTVAGGDYFDIVRGIDQLYARIQESVIGLLQANGKVSYTQKGIGMVVGTIQGVLDKQSKPPINFLSSEQPPVATGPALADIDVADRAARLLPDVSFTGTVQGAIHAVQISGEIAI